MQKRLLPLLLAFLALGTSLSAGAQTPPSAVQADHTDAANSDANSPQALAAARECSAKVGHYWDHLSESQRNTQIIGGGGIISLAFSPDGSTLASGCRGGAVKLWDVATGRELRALAGHESAVKSLAFSPDGSTLASASGGGVINDSVSNDTVMLWDVATGRPRPAVAKGTGFDMVDSVAFSPDGRTFATADNKYGTIKLWDVETKETTLTLNAGAVTYAAFGPDGHTLASASDYDGGTLTLWDAGTGRELLTFGVGAPNCFRHCTYVAFSPDGHIFAVGSGYGDAAVELWDAATGQKLRTLESVTGGLNSVAFSPDSKTLAAGINSRIVIWDIASGQKLRTLSHALNVRSVAFSPDGRTLAAGNDEATIELWDVATGQVLRTLGTSLNLAWLGHESN